MNLNNAVDLIIYIFLLLCVYKYINDNCLPIPGTAGTSFFVQKQRIYRHFLETCLAQNLRDLPEAEMLQAQPLTQDCYEDVDAHGDLKLVFHRILGCAEEGHNVQMLLHPFEEQFDLPTCLVEGCDDMRRQHEVVGDED